MTDNDITQQKNWENLEIMKKISQNNRQMSVAWAKNYYYYSLDSAVEKYRNNIKTFLCGFYVLTSRPER